MTDAANQSFNNVSNRVDRVSGGNLRNAKPQQERPQSTKQSKFIGAQDGNGEFSERKRRQEASRLAGTARSTQNRATELAQAAAGAGDPEERQKLLNEALQKEVEAESFGKTAKWLSAGSTQGFLVGSGIGAFPGITLGTLTGTLVGGLTSMILGGLGGLVGAGVGAIHGPFLKLGHVMGGAIKKVVPTIPGWAATDEQKRALERMLGQIKEQERPTDDELMKMQQSVPVTSSRISASAENAKKMPQSEKSTASPNASKSYQRQSKSVQSTDKTAIKTDHNNVNRRKKSIQNHSQQNASKSRDDNVLQNKKIPKKLEIRSKAS